MKPPLQSHRHSHPRRDSVEGLLPSQLILQFLLKLDLLHHLLLEPLDVGQPPIVEPVVSLSLGKLERMSRAR
jgi:hypothetical protein